MKQNEIDYEQEKEILKSNLRICIILFVLVLLVERLHAESVCGKGDFQQRHQRLLRTQLQA